MSSEAIAPQRLVVGFLLLLVAGATGACAIGKRQWNRADDFVAGLQCHMSEDAVRAQSERFRQLHVHEPSSAGMLVARKGNTQILLWFSEDGLVAYQVTWTYPLTSYASELKTELCTGERFVDVRLVGNSSLSGASVWLDGERLGEISSAGTYSLDVPLGTHELRVEKGDARWGTQLSYSPSSPGNDRLPISLAEDEEEDPASNR